MGLLFSIIITCQKKSELKNQVQKLRFKTLIHHLAVCCRISSGSTELDHGMGVVLGLETVGGTDTIPMARVSPALVFF
jgi:hypothetical protein